MSDELRLLLPLALVALVVAALVVRGRGGDGITRPPAVLPLLAVCAVALVLVNLLIEVLDEAWLLGDLAINGVPEDDDVEPGRVALELVLDAVLLVLVSVLLRRVVAWWVRRQPADPAMRR